MEICQRLNLVDHQNEISYGNDLERKWHQLWIESLEMQYLFEERLKVNNG